MTSPKVIGICGWKNSGKTTLVSNLIAEFTARGYVVGSIKHAHHKFDIDHEGTDSYNHRECGAQQVAIVSQNRVAMIEELKNREEPSLEAVLTQFDGCEMVIVEGYKRAPIPKIEAIRNASVKNAELWKDDQNFIAIAGDEIPAGCPLPYFDQDSISSIADFITNQVGLEEPVRSVALNA